MSEMNEAPAGYVCKGAWVLGSACGECSRCLKSLPEFLAEDGMPARRARAIIAAYKTLHPVAPGGDEAALAIARAKLTGQDAEIAHQRNINTLPTDANEQLRQDFHDAWTARDAMREERDKLAAQVDALAGATVSDYSILSSTGDFSVELVRQRGGGALWAVRRNGNCLNKYGEFEWEPMRDDEFMERCRFESAEAAIAAAHATIKTGE